MAIIGSEKREVPVAKLGYLYFFRNYKSSSHCTRSQDYLVIKNYHANSEIGKLAKNVMLHTSETIFPKFLEFLEVDI